VEEKANLSDIFDLTFTKFVTPIVIKVAFIVVMLVAGLVWLGAIFAGFQSGFWGGIGGLIFGGLGFLMIVLLYRIMFELVMVIFAIKRNTDRLP
jgi:fatty acid desaturase